MVIDIHVHPAFFEPINGDEEKEQLRHDELNLHKNGTAPLKHFFNKMKCAGIDRVCLLPEDYSSGSGGEPLVSNEEIRRLVGLAPDRFIGFASVDPHDEKAPEKLERAFAEYGLKGLKLHPARQHFAPADKLLDPLYDICEKYDRPVIFHSGLSFEPHALTENCHPLKFEPLAEKRPGLRISLAHFGWPWCREVAMLMLKYPNVYTDTGALYFDSAREFYTQMLTRDVPLTWIDRSLRHQVMFGTNDPRFEMIRMAQAIAELGFRESTLELIMGGNAVEFLHYDPERSAE
ncbi:MAG: amidohydrolase family protein [Erysipelotrichaceae bacterium]|nr:amidohydrolase family protein [Erysipelotrichaceae bacterium]